MLFKKNFFLFIAIIISSHLLAQNNNSGTITGIIKDESTERPIEFVSVSLFQKSDSTVVSGTTSDKNGKFDISNVQFGEYFIKLSFVGYKEKTTVSFIIDTQHKKLNFNTLYLAETAVSLDEILVSSKKAVFNNAIDRKVYNVDQDVLSKSGSASEVLQNIPSIEVDIDGNVSLRGSSNVLIMINGKTSPLMGKNRATVLQQMPANSIEKIEVITNPSAKYKPDGTSGIINLVLKKNTDMGLNGNIGVNAGNKDRYNGNVRINYNPGDFNLFGSYSFRKDNRNRINTDTRDQFDVATITHYREDLFSYASPLSNMISLGIDYNIDEMNSFGLSGSYFYNSFTRTDNSKKVLQNSSFIPIQDYDRNRIDYEFEKEYGLTFFFQHNFTKEDHKLRFEFSSSQAPEVEDNHFNNVYWLPPNATTYDNTLIKQGDNQTQLSIDYSVPVSEEANLEAGYSGDFNNKDMDFYAENFDLKQQKFVKDILKTNRFIFDESIHALYTTYEHSFGKFGFLLGLRAEQAFTKSNLVTKDSIMTNDYFNMYSTLHLSYQFSKTSELQMNYSRRVHRPEADDLNPFPEYRDARNISAGNPLLLPEYIHSVELGCKLENDQFSVLPAIYYRYTYNRFSSITQSINDSTLLTTRKNLSNDQSAGIELILSANLGDFFTAHLSGNAFYNRIDASNLGYSNDKSIVTWSSALTFSLNFTKNTMLQVNSNYSSARLTPQGETFPSYVVNFGVRQELFDGNLSLILTVADLFNTLKRKVELNTPLLNQTVINARDSRIIYFGCTYHFGKKSKKSKEESLKYDDNI